MFNNFFRKKTDDLGEMIAKLYGTEKEYNKNKEEELKQTELKIRTEKKNVEKLNQVLELAENIIKDEKENYLPIKLYVNSFGQMVRDKLLMQLYSGEEVYVIEDLFNDLGFRLGKFMNVDLSKEEEKKIDIYLDRDMAIPIAWNRDRFISNIIKIGKERNNPFLHDAYNHKAYLFFPVKLSIVYNGNHSILTGILKKEGMIKSNYIFDMSSKYNEIKFDGTYYRDINTNEILHEVKNFELGAIFEIGRLLVEYNIKL